MFSANLKQFILTAHTQSLPICVPVPDYKVEVRRLDAVEDVTFPGTMSRTRITADRLKVVLLHAMQNLVARTTVPQGVEDFLQTNAPARTAAQQGVLRTAHASIRASLHNLVAHLLLSGVPVFIAGESADVKATVAALKATVAEDMYQCDVAIYNLSTKTPLYTSTSHLVSIRSATAFDNRLPRYVAFTEGPMSSVMPVEIFSFLLSLVPVPERAGNWFLLGTLSVYFASMMPNRFSKDCNVVCALLGEETVVRDELVQSIRAAITNADTCPPKSWEDVYHDLGAGFPVDCSGVRYVDEDPEEQDGEAEWQSETHTPKKKPKTAPAPSPSGTQCAQATLASSSGTVAPTGRGMNAFVNHF